jgi:Flp pilus assembly pilin Flp
MTKFTTFLHDETGAVTVDWVVLTAGIVGMGIVVFSFVRPSVSNIAVGIGDELGHAKACLLDDPTQAC